MGLFSKQGATSEPPAFSSARLGPVLEGLGINFAVDDDGTHLGDWDNCRIFFEATGEKNELLHFRAYWDIRPPADEFVSLVLSANEWNLSRRWPRMFVAPGDVEATLAVLRRHSATAQAVVLGEVTAGRGVSARTALGTVRRLAPPSGEQLPRIC